MLQVHQVHGRDVIVHPQANPDPSADGLMTDDPGCAVAVRVADCAALLIADRRQPVVAAVHAGWRGTASGIAGAAIEALRARYGSQPRELLVAIGPSIRQCCYEVGPEVRQQFAASGHVGAHLERWFSPGTGDRWMLDVPRANRDQLETAGVPPDQIFDSGLCTSCYPEVFHSYRKSGGAGRMMGVITLSFQLQLRPSLRSTAGPPRGFPRGGRA